MWMCFRSQSQYITLSLLSPRSRPPVQLIVAHRQNDVFMSHIPGSKVIFYFLFNIPMKIVIMGKIVSIHLWTYDVTSLHYIVSKVQKLCSRSSAVIIIIIRDITKDPPPLAYIINQRSYKKVLSILFDYLHCWMMLFYHSQVSQRNQTELLMQYTLEWSWAWVYVHVSNW